jgi:hypothetical protein
MPGRQPPPSIVTVHFTQLKKVDNKSNHYWWKCNHCSVDTRIQGRDNNHVKHLTDLNKCPRAPQDIHKAALVFLAAKGVKDNHINDVMYDFEELDHIDEGHAPHAVDEDVTML